MKKIKISRILLIAIASFLFNFDLALASNNPGEIVLNKVANKDDVTYGRSANVTLEVTANSFTKTDKTDIVLVIDRSTSMNDGPMVEAKEAAVQLVQTLLSNDNVKVAITTYGYTYLKEYSSDLSNDADDLISTINSIPNDFEEGGTNIHSALVQANKLLAKSTATNKIVILLSDGVPNRYDGTKDICKKANLDKCGSSVKIDGKKYKGVMEVTKAYADYLKKSALIYTVGFNFDNLTDTNKVIATDILEYISTSDKTNFLADDLNALKTVFSNIAKELTTIAENGVVTDIVPPGFHVIENTLKVSTGCVSTVGNGDGTTTITWNIEKISSIDNPSLTYKVLANLGHYGSMYTNVVATLKADAVEGNPTYPDGGINLLFKMPNVPIPSVTNNDDYGNVEQGKTLTVDISNSILTNDELITKHIDANSEVINKIILVTDEETNGNIEKIDLNDELGTFTYVTSKDELGKITYKYYVESEVIISGNSTIVKSNESYITFNVIKNPTSYTVKYLEEGTNVILHNSKSGSGYVYDEINESAIQIDGYNLISDNNQTIMLDMELDKNVIIFYYNKRSDLSYTVNYLEKNTNNILSDQKVINNQEYGTIINSQNEIIEIDGYKYDSVSTEKLFISTKENVINIYYIKLMGKVTAIYVDTKGDYLIEPIETRGMVTTEYKTSAQKINKYHLLKIEGDEVGKYTEEDILVKYIYDFVEIEESVVPEIPQTGVNLEIKHYISLISLSIIGLTTLIIKRKYLN